MTKLSPKVVIFRSCEVGAGTSTVPTHLSKPVWSFSRAGRWGGDFELGVASRLDSSVPMCPLLSFFWEPVDPVVAEPIAQGNDRSNNIQIYCIQKFPIKVHRERSNWVPDNWVYRMPIFGNFPILRRNFPIFRGFARFVLSSSRVIKKHPLGTFPKRSATQSEPFPREVGGNPPVWKPPVYLPFS